jgi:hypothetical protein
MVVLAEICRVKDKEKKYHHRDGEAVRRGGRITGNRNFTSSPDLIG